MKVNADNSNVNSKTYYLSVDSSQYWPGRDVFAEVCPQVPQSKCRIVPN